MSHSSTSNSEGTWAGYREDELVPRSEGSFSPGIRRVTAIIVSVIFFAVGFGGGMLDLFFPQPLPSVIGREKVQQDRERSLANFSDGSLARLFEKDCRLTSTVRSFSLPLYAGALFTLFGEADPTQVVVGEDGWVFQLQRLCAKDLPEAKLAVAPATIISALTRRFALAGTKLVILPVPRKEELYQQHLAGRHFPIRPELYEALLVALRARGVIVVDTARAIRAADGGRENMFYKTDSHWNLPGALAAAEECARILGIQKPVAERATMVKTHGTALLCGDLLRMAGLFRPDRSGCAWALEEHANVGFVKRSDGAPSALLAAPKMVDHALAGTSYSWVEQVLPRSLAHVTDLEWYAAVWPALGPVEPLRRCVREMVKQRFPRLLVWEIPDYELFCVNPELLGIDGVFALLPSARLSPLLPAETDLATVWAKKGTLTVGATHEVGRTPLATWLPENLIVYPGDGSVSLRLTGAVNGAAIRVTAVTDGGRFSALWEAGRAEVILPLIAPAESRKLHLTVMAPTGPATLRLDGLELVSDIALTDVATMGARALKTASAEAWEQEFVFDAPPALGTGAACVVELSRLKPSAYPLRIAVEEDGEKPRTIEMVIQNGNSRHTVVIGLSTWEAGRVKRIRVSGAGKDPGSISRACLGEIRSTDR